MKKLLPPEVVAPILATLKKAIAENEALAKNIGEKEIEKCGDTMPGKDMSKNASMGYPAAGTPPAGMGAGVVKEEPKAGGAQKGPSGTYTRPDQSKTQPHKFSLGSSDRTGAKYCSHCGEGISHENHDQSVKKEEPKAEMDPATGDSCPKCGDKGIHAGQMGSQEHYLCKGCGQNYSHPAMDKSDWAPHAGKKVKAPGSGGLKKEEPKAYTWVSDGKTSSESHQKMADKHRDEADHYNKIGDTNKAKAATERMKFHQSSVKKDAFPQVIKPNPMRSPAAIRGAPGETTKIPNAKDQAQIQARSKLGKTELKKTAFGPSDKAHSASLMANVLGTTASHQKAAALHAEAAQHATSIGNLAAAKMHTQANAAHTKYSGATPQPSAAPAPMAKALPSAQRSLSLPGMTPAKPVAKPSFLGGLLERNGHGPTSVGQANKELGGFQSLASNPTAMPGNVVAKEEPKASTSPDRPGTCKKCGPVSDKAHHMIFVHAGKSPNDFFGDVKKDEFPTATGDAMPQSPSQKTIGNKSAGVASPAAETKPKADK